MRGAALWVTLSRPEAFNALTPASVAGIDRALAGVEANAGVRSVILTGEGKAFCAGADLKAVLATGTDTDANALTSRFLRDVGRVFDRLAALPVPTVAAVNGMAVAGGLELVLCCDIVVAASTASLGDGHANYGQVPAGGGSLRLPRRIGAARAKYLMLTGLNIDARRALDWGLVDELAEPGELVARASALASRFERHSALVLRRMKALVDAGLSSTARDVLDAELRSSDLHMSAYDRNEGLAAFAEKRQPRYLGR
jgi:enoyl-CoA hydratase/carnithine racemase